MLSLFLLPSLSFLNNLVQKLLGGAEQDECLQGGWEEPQWPRVVCWSQNRVGRETGDPAQDVGAQAG